MRELTNNNPVMQEMRSKLVKAGVDKELVTAWTAAQLQDIIKHTFESAALRTLPFDVQERIARCTGESSLACDAAFVVHTLRQAETTQGHTCTESAAVQRALEQRRPTSSWAATREHVIRHNTVFDYRAVDGTHYLYTASMWRAESGLIHKLSMLFEREPSPRQADIEACLPTVCSNLNLTAHQEAGVRRAFKHGVSIVTGPAGCGKTTAVAALYDVARQVDMTVLFAAPTGAAAKRMRVQFDAPNPPCTIHKLLGGYVDGSGRFAFKHHSRKPIVADMIILDEASMLDTWLFAKLMDAVSPSTTSLVLLGDHNQLPSVGAGRVLSDLLSSSCVPATILTQVMRQASHSTIIKAAHQILSGKLDMDPGDYGDMEWVVLEDPADILTELQDRVVASELLPQVLCPRRTSTNAGVYTGQLNRLLQKTLNGPSVAAQRLLEQRERGSAPGCPYAVGDPVVFLRNDPQLGLLNGDKGVVTGISWGTHPSPSPPPHHHKHGSGSGSGSRSGWQVTVQYDEFSRTHRAGNPDLDLSYALTVHKSQGDEFDTVIVVLDPSHIPLLQREMLYTAITRAKSKVLLLASRAVIDACVRNVGVDARCTLLSERLALHFQNSAGGSGGAATTPTTQDLTCRKMARQLYRLTSAPSFAAKDIFAQLSILRKALVSALGGGGPSAGVDALPRVKLGRLSSQRQARDAVERHVTDIRSILVGRRAVKVTFLANADTELGAAWNVSKGRANAALVTTMPAALRTAEAIEEDVDAFLCQLIRTS